MVDWLIFLSINRHCDFYFAVPMILPKIPRTKYLVATEATFLLRNVAQRLNYLTPRTIKIPQPVIDSMIHCALADFCCFRQSKDR